jgi:DNA-directed RNA polymerase subunit RPC12/RpoP
VRERDLVQVRCSQTKKMFRRPRSEIGRLAPCPHCGRRHVVKEAASRGG